MKLKVCHVKNFGSYKEFTTDFESKGLTLLHGKTGSGKSTIPDMVFWIIFGETAKGGSVDDIRNWQSDEATIGTLQIETNEGPITITRIRGKTSENDLYWTKADGDEPIRGKDLKDTQRLLQEIIGVSPLLYEVGAYSHEFSPIGNFFLAKAKDRRAIFEQIADLSIPKRLAEQASARRKTVKDKIDTLNVEVSVNRARLEQMADQCERTSKVKDKWDSEHKATILSLISKSNAFDTDKAIKVAALTAKSDQFEGAKKREFDLAKAEFDALSAAVKPAGEVEDAILKLKFKLKELEFEKCRTCNGPVDSPLRDKYLNQVTGLEAAHHINQRNLDKLESVKRTLARSSAIENPYLDQIDEMVSKVNTYAEIIAAKQAEINPHTDQIIELVQQMEALADEAGERNSDVLKFEHEMALLNKLYDLSFDLRGAMLQTTVKQVQDRTNKHMETYFEGELRVTLVLDTADTLQVELAKNGYVCGYKQLSKGQRGLLKLCFSIAIMEAASNQAGVDFQTLFFDEALDGLDTDFKVKAFDLLQELSKSHGSIFVIDHAIEFQNLFENQIHVTMTEDISCVDDSTFMGVSAYESTHDEERTGST